MRILFILSFLLLTIADIYTAIKFHQKKLNLYFKSVLLSYGLLCLFLLAAYFFDIVIPYYIWILVIVSIFAHTFMGYYLDFYNRSRTVFDRILHAFGTFTSSLFFYTFLANITEAGGSKLFRAVFVAALGIAIGSIFENLEFMVDKKQHTKTQRGLKDTNTDMVANLIGGIVAAVFACFVFL